MVGRFLNSADAREIVFVRGATEGINLVAQTWGRANVGRGDEIVVSAMEHHSNIVPWQILCEQKGARLRVAPVNDAGELMMDEFEKLLGPKTKLVAIAHVSNALGTVNPVRRIVEAAQQVERPRAARRRPGRPAHVGGRVRSGLRLLRLLRTQGVWAHRNRCVVWQSRTARLHAALSRRRRHDQFGHLREDAVQPRCRKNSKPARRTSPAPSDWPRRCNT